MRKLFVTSKPMGGRRRLIGELTEENGEYTFEYKLGGKLPEWYLQLDEFPDLTKVYKGAEVRPFIERMIPKPSFRYIEDLLKPAGLEKYDEWRLLIYCGPHNQRDDAFLFEQIPQGVLRYDG